MSWIIVSIVITFGILLIIFTIIRNQKDKEDFEQKMNNNYPKPKDEKSEFNDDGL